jgi:hypothetical protein
MTDTPKQTISEHLVDHSNLVTFINSAEAKSAEIQHVVPYEMSFRYGSTADTYVKTYIVLLREAKAMPIVNSEPGGW